MLSDEELLAVPDQDRYIGAYFHYLNVEKPEGWPDSWIVRYRRAFYAREAARKELKASNQRRNEIRRRGDPEEIAAYEVENKAILERYYAAKRKLSRAQRPKQEQQRRRGVRARRLTDGQKREILDRQGGACAICHKHPFEAFVDHDHTTGVIRGLLCPSCNALLGHSGDSAERLRSRAERIRAFPYVAVISVSAQEVAELQAETPHLCDKCGRPVSYEDSTKAHPVAWQVTRRVRRRDSGAVVLLCGTCGMNLSQGSVPADTLESAAAYLEHPPAVPLPPP